MVLVLVLLCRFGSVLVSGRFVSGLISRCAIWILVVSTSASEWPERLVSKMTYNVLMGTLNPTYSLTRPPFRLTASVSWCWLWEKEGRADDVVPGIQDVHWQFSMCTLHSYQDQFIQPGWAVCFCVFSLGFCFVRSFVLFDLFVSPFFYVSLSSWVISLTV